MGESMGVVIHAHIPSESWDGWGDEVTIDAVKELLDELAGSVGGCECETEWDSVWDTSGTGNYGLDDDSISETLNQLAEWGIEWDAWDEPKYELGGQRLSWRRGMEKAQRWDADSDGSVILTERVLRELMSDWQNQGFGTFMDAVESKLPFPTLNEARAARIAGGK
jgi:hypothetical protein